MYEPPAFRISSRTWISLTAGAAGQNAANARLLGPDAARAEFGDAVSRAWEEPDPDGYPFTRAVAEQLHERDDREQFLAGIDLVLTGITALRPPRRG